jgi:hypothetical protein
MNTATPNTATNGPKATGRLATNLGGVALLVGAIVDALGIYFYNWPGSTLLFVFVLGFLAYAIGKMIEGRGAGQA